MNILSVDFDIIMAPDLPLYNNLIRVGECPLKIVQERFPILQYVKADLGIYQTLVPRILQITKDLKPQDIRVSFSHEDIKYMLEDLKDVTVYNIDHHHDLGYGPDCEECTCANWGDYFIKKGIIKNMIWINNENSDLNHKYKDSDQVGFLHLKDFSFNNLPHIDKVFICLSGEWVSEMYHPLFFTLIDLINQQKNCHLEIH